LLAALEQAVADAAADAVVRVVVLGAEGTVFCSGHDLSEMTGGSCESCTDLFGLCSRVMLGLRRSPQPVIARVQRTAYEQLGLGEPAAYERAVAVMTENALSRVAQEGMQAFLQKRNAVRTGD